MSRGTSVSRLIDGPQAGDRSAAHLRGDQARLERGGTGAPAADVSVGEAFGREPSPGVAARAAEEFQRPLGRAG
jgi:hypothetical protein